VGEIFRTCPDRPWGPPSLLYNGYRVFPGVRNLPRRTLTPHPLLVLRSKTRVELYVYSPYGAMWPVKRVKPTYFMMVVVSVKIPEFVICCDFVPHSKLIFTFVRNCLLSNFALFFLWRPPKLYQLQAAENLGPPLGLLNVVSIVS
jgi:hypothetical protein